MYCRQCGTPNVDNAVRCEKCGVQLIGMPEQQPMAPPQRVNNHLAEAIIVTFFGFFCFIIPVIPGIVAIIYASRVNTKLQQGDYAGAVDSSKKAMTWMWVSLGLILVMVAVYIIAAVGAGTAGRNF